MGGNDTVGGLAGDDLVCGGRGDDELRGQGGDDTLKGGRGKDELRGGGGSNKCRGGKGSDSKQTLLRRPSRLTGSRVWAAGSPSQRRARAKLRFSSKAQLFTCIGGCLPAEPNRGPVARRQPCG